MGYGGVFVGQRLASCSETGSGLVDDRVCIRVLNRAQQWPAEPTKSFSCCGTLVEDKRTRIRALIE